MILPAWLTLKILLLIYCVGSGRSFWAGFLTAWALLDLLVFAARCRMRNAKTSV